VKFGQTAARPVFSEELNIDELAEAQFYLPHLGLKE
jgi:hypothetical protein